MFRLFRSKKAKQEEAAKKTSAVAEQTEQDPILAERKRIADLASEVHKYYDLHPDWTEHHLAKDLRALQPPTEPKEHSDEIKFSREIPTQDSNIRYSLRREPTDDSSIRYSRRSDPAPDIHQFSPRNDNYSEVLVQQAMDDIRSGKKKYSGTSEMKDIINKSFVEKLIEYVAASGEKDSEIYIRAGIDRRLYSKIMSDNSYTPSKDTCIALCFGLRLSLNNTNDMLARCGYILSHSSVRDMVFEYFLANHIYDLNDINSVLDYYNLRPLAHSAIQ